MKTIIHSEIEIKRSPEAVTSVLLDPTKAVLWTSGLERFEVVSGNPGEVGSVARLHYLEGGRRYVMTDELLEADPGRRYVSRVRGDVLEAVIETVLSPTEGGTHLSLRWTGRGRSLPFRLLLPLMRGAVARHARSDLVKLKHLVESEQQSNH